MNDLNPVTAQTALSHVPIERVAVVLVDLQNDFCHPDAWPNNTRNTRTALKAQRFALEAAHMGARVIYTRQEVAPEILTPRQVRWEQGPRWGSRASWGAELFVQPVPQSSVVVKSRYDVWQSAEFLAALERDQIDGVVVGGVELRCCVLFAVLGAVERGYHYVVPLDLVSGMDDGERTYNRAVRAYLRSAHGAPVTSNRILAEWRARLPEQARDSFVGGHNRVSAVRRRSSV